MQNSIRNKQVLLPQEDDGLPLENDGLVGVALTVCAKVLGAQVREVILSLDACQSSPPPRALARKSTSCDGLCARTVGAVAGDVQYRRCIDVQQRAAEALVEALLQPCFF